MSSNSYTRQDFLKTITGATLASIAALPVAARGIPAKNQSTEYKSIPSNAVILFQGDSITDAGRDKNIQEPNNTAGLGNGYAFLISASLMRDYPGENLSLYNRGISGNKVFELAARWDEDCIDLKPDILSILVGVNDFWHTLDSGYDGTLEVYEEDFRKLLNRTRKALPDVKLIIGEPFALQAGSAVDNNWFPEFNGYRAAAKRIAADEGAAFIPYQDIFDKASEGIPATYWSADGVHPTIAGNELMARAWLETVKRM